MRRLALLLTLAFAGCGLGAGEHAGEVHVAVTRDFGAATVGQPRTEGFKADETVLRLLERTHDVQTQFGGAFVASLDGAAGGDGKDWFFFVNGLEATKGAGDVALRAGDRVWWDLHAWTEDVPVPAVVGSFPQPFAGRPTRVECSAAEATCENVRERLTAAGAKLTETDGARVIVGPLNTAVPFARAEGGDIELLDAAGEPRSILPAGGGLVAATAESGVPIWVVSGADEAGISAAAASLTEGRLANRVALAIAPGGDTALPVR